VARPAPNSHPAPTLSTPRIVVSPWIVLLTLTLGFFMILLDTTIVNVAIPSIIDGLNASLDQILWILNAYVLTYAVLLITTGRLGDMVGPKKLFLIGLVIFTLSSAACGIAQNPAELITFRVIQGIGGAILTPQTLSIITSIFPPERRGAAFGVWGAVAGLAAVAGPTLGGFLTTQFSWRAIFYVNVPIGIIAFILAWLLMPELTSHRRHHIDFVGVALATSGLFVGVFGLIEGQRYNWGPINTFGSFSIGGLHASVLSIPTLLLLSIVLLVVFILGEGGSDEPLLPLSLFSDRNFTVANGVSLIVSFGMFSLFLPLTIFLQSVRGFSAEDAGFILVPMSLTATFIAPFTGRLTDRMSGKWILAVGLVVFAAGLGFVIKVASLNSTGWNFTLPLIIAGLGMGCTFAPLTTLAMRGVAPAMAGSASGFLNTVRQVGGALGSAIVGAILQYKLSNELHSQAAKYSSQLPAKYRGQFVQGFSHSGSRGLDVGRGQTGAQLPSGLPHTVAARLQHLGELVFQHAFLNAMKPTLALPIAVLVLGGILATFMKTSGTGAQGQRATSPQLERSAATGD
jgi:EmrB/QacA subfamily drug resistance transporter